MVGLGTIINTVFVVLGGLIGYFFGNLLKERHQDTLERTCGVCVLFIGISGAMTGMLKVNGSDIESVKSMMVILSLVFGSLIGEIINIEAGFERFGKWLKYKTGNAKDAKFVDAFLNASFTVSIGAMAIIGPIDEGLTGDFSILMMKSVLDLIIIIVMTSAEGKGCIFSAIPIFVMEGTFTILARFLKPIMTNDALSNLSLVGSILIFSVGLNLVFGKKIKVANLLPSLIFAVIAAFLPYSILQ